METGSFDRKIQVTSTAPRVSRRSFKSNWILLFVCAAVISLSSIILTKPTIVPQPPTQPLKIFKHIANQNDSVSSIKEDTKSTIATTKDQATVSLNTSSSAENRNISQINSTSNQVPEAVRKIINPASLLNDTQYGNRTFHLIVLTRMRSGLLKQTLTKLFEIM